MQCRCWRKAKAVLVSFHLWQVRINVINDAKVVQYNSVFCFRYGPFIVIAYIISNHDATVFSSLLWGFTQSIEQESTKCPEMQ